MSDSGPRPTVPATQAPTSTPTPASTPATPAATAAAGATSTAAPTARLRLIAAHLDEMVAHCLRAYPEEGCGLITGDPATGSLAAVHGTRNLAASAQIYTVDPIEHLQIDRSAEAAGLAVIGVFHSHTHTDPYPSPTDVGQAPDPAWHYVLVSLRHEVASVRSYRIVDGVISEESIEIEQR